MGKRPRSRRIYYAYFEEETNGTWAVHVPALPGCYSQGRTFEEARAHIVEAIQGYLESARKDERACADPGRAVVSAVEVEA